MRKLLSTDIDGTLLFNATISPTDLAAVTRWRDAGNLLVPNTGRSVAALRSALRGYDLAFDYSVLYTGAALIGPDYGVLEARTLPDSFAEEILDMLEGETGVTVFVTTLDGDLQLYDSIGSDTALLTLFSQASRTDLAGRTIVGVPLRITDPALLARVQAEIANRWGDVAIAFQNQDFLDIVPAGSSKGAGLTALVDLLTADDGPYPGERIETWSAGDSWNDISMHEAADHAVAMDGAPPEVLAVCERTTTSVAALIDSALAGSDCTAPLSPPGRFSGSLGRCRRWKLRSGGGVEDGGFDEGDAGGQVHDSQDVGVVDGEIDGFLQAWGRSETYGDLGESGRDGALFGDDEPDLLDDLVHQQVRGDMVLRAQSHAETLDHVCEVSGL